MSNVQGVILFGTFVICACIVFWVLYETFNTPTAPAPWRKNYQKTVCMVDHDALIEEMRAKHFGGGSCPDCEMWLDCNKWHTTTVVSDGHEVPDKIPDEVIEMPIPVRYRKPSQYKVIQ